MSDDPLEQARDEVLARLSNQESSFRELDARRNEETRVNYLLTACGLSQRKRSLLTACETRTGDKRLTLALFNELVPNFPFLLGYSDLDGIKLHTSSAATMAALFTHFDAAPFVPFYEEVVRQLTPLANGRAPSLLFTRYGINLGLVMAELAALEALPYLGTSFTHHDKNGAVGVRSLAGVVKGLLASGWRPELAF